jgi:hypothetical protein
VLGLLAVSAAQTRLYESLLWVVGCSEVVAGSWESWTFEVVDVWINCCQEVFDIGVLWIVMVVVVHPGFNRFSSPLHNIKERIQQ